MKKVVFFVTQEESDVYEFSDDVTQSELQYAADQWVAENVGASYAIVEEDE